MKSEEAVERMRDIEGHLICFNSQLDIAIMNGWEGQKAEAIKDIAKFKQRAKKIFENFEDGCRELFQQKGETDYDSCGIYQWFCPNCKEIKQIHDVLSENQGQQINTEDKGNTSPSLPPRKKEESLEGGCDEDLLASADTNLSEKAEVKV